MTRLPSGTVTFLLTDVEGSTSAWESDPDATRAAIEGLDALVAEVVTQHAGIVVKARGEGDSHFCVFETATDAIAAGVNLLRRVPTTGLSVRAAVHTGEADLRDGDYYGRTVNRAARLRAVGHGGQLLVSEVSASLARGTLAEGIELRDLGAHHLKDLSSSESIFEAGHPDLPKVTLPLATLDLESNQLHGVPLPRDRFVGREEDKATLLTVLNSARVVTVVGPGGTGKTRLAAEVATAAVGRYEHGVWFVELASVRDDDEVTDRIRAALRAPITPGAEVHDALAMHLGSQQVLLVLDNCEQVLVGVSGIVDRLVDAAPGITVLATSRTALGVRGEVVRELGGLPVSDAEESGTAVALFVERARAVAPSVQVDQEQIGDVAALCRRLDGSPLAIELAAARFATLSPGEILDRISDRFDILKRRGAASAERHGSLHAAIDWSHDLLQPEEQVLFRRTAVFAGSFTLTAAERVCSGEQLPSEEVLDLVAELAAKSLLVVDRRRTITRYRMTEATRQYARERLAAAGEDLLLAPAHRAWYQQVALDAAPHLRGPALAEWLDALDEDIDDLRLAMRTALRDGEGGVAMQIATALLEYWMVRGNWKEGQQWLEDALVSRGDVDPALVFRALDSSAVLADLVSDYGLCEARATELLELAGGRSDRHYEVRALLHLGSSHVRRGNDTLGRGFLQEAAALLRDSDDPTARNRAIAVVASLTDSWAASRRLREESVELARAKADPEALAGELLSLGNAARMTGSAEAAAMAFREALDIAHGLTYDRYIARALSCLGELALDVGDPVTARPLLEQAAKLWPNVGHLNGVTDSLLDLAELARLDGDIPQAQSWARQALAISQRLSIRRHEAEARRLLSVLARQTGDLDAARQLALESAQLAGRVPDQRLLSRALEVLGGLAGDEGHLADAARLFGVAEGIRTRIGLVPTVVEASVVEEDCRRGRGADPSWDANLASARLARPEDVLVPLGIDSPLHPDSDRNRGGATGPVRGLCRREGSHVTVAFGGPPFTVTASKGTDYIAALLRRPGEEIHVLALTGASDGSSGPMIDDEAREKYRLRLEDLREDAAEAEAFNDPERAARAGAEIERLAGELSRAVGLGGKTRLAGSTAERARLNVTRAIRSAISRITTHDPRLGHHLDSTIRTGTYCSYVNDPVTPVTWSFGDP